jgi:formiminoglutamate deiminase
VHITVEHGRFVEVAPESHRVPDAVHLRGVTIPGLANTHSHAFHRALRSRTQADRGSFWTWRNLMYAAADRLDPDTYHRLARAAFAEMTLAGITSVGEFHYVHHQPGGVAYENPNAMGEAVLAAAAEAGVRITLLDTLYLHGGLAADGYQPVTGPQRRFADSSADGWAERVDLLEPRDGQIIGGAIHSVRAVDPLALHVAAQWAAATAAPLHAHVSEQTIENDQCRAHHHTSPVEVLHEAGALTERFTAVHATHVDDHDMRLLAESGATVCLCPTTERDLGDGIADTTALHAAGVPISLGSDSHAVIDHFVESRSVELHERLRSHRRGIHSAPELMAMATGGHASLGWQDAGVIAPNHRADLVAVNLGSVRAAGSSTLETIVFSAIAADVTDVVVDGRVIVQGGQHHHLDVAADLELSIAALMDT